MYIQQIWKLLCLTKKYLKIKVFGHFISIPVPM